MDYQWYPGHMTKARRMMEENIRLIDLLIELTDARAPYSGKNPDIDTLARGKSRIIVLNKSDLSDEKQNNAWKNHFEKAGFLVCLTDSRNGGGLSRLKPLIDEACREKIERDRKRGIMNRPVRAMIAGIPNVGKSTFINSFAGRAAAKTGNKPGVTKGKQWIRLNKNLELLDTPGILWPKFEDQEIGKKLAVIGSIRDEIQDSQELAVWLSDWLRKSYPGTLQQRYGIDEKTTGAALLEEVAGARGCLKSGGMADTERAAQLMIDDFRSGKLGRITLEFPVEED